MAAPDRQIAFAGRSPPADAYDQSALGIFEPAVQPLSNGQARRANGAQQRLPLTDLGQGATAERDGAVGVAAELGEVGTVERDRRGNVCEGACGPADGGLE
jgi:hypothetical protein